MEMRRVRRESEGGRPLGAGKALRMAGLVEGALVEMAVALEQRVAALAEVVHLVKRQEQRQQEM